MGLFVCCVWNVPNGVVHYKLLADALVICLIFSVDCPKTAFYRECIQYRAESVMIISKATKSSVKSLTIGNSVVNEFARNRIIGHTKLTARIVGRTGGSIG